jgi:hypothetical protein
LPTDLSITDNNFITKLKSNINRNGNVAVNVIYSFYLPIDVVTEKSIKFRFREMRTNTNIIEANGAPPRKA